MGKKALIKIGDYFIVTGWNGDPSHLGEQLLNITFNETFPFLQTVIGAARNFAVISISENLRKTHARKKTLSSYDLENVVDFSEYDGDVDYVYEIDYPVVAVVVAGIQTAQQCEHVITGLVVDHLKHKLHRHW